jgi:microcystin-dependent protein
MLKFNRFDNNVPYVNCLVRRTPRLCPVGSVTLFAGSVNDVLPEGWLYCDGSAVSREAYKKLFDIIGTNYGSGNGTTTFNLPDTRGRAPVGAGQGSGLTNRLLGVTGGAETHTLTASEMPSHTHTINDPGHTHSYVNNTNDQGTDNVLSSETAADNADLSATTGSSTTGITINSTGGGQAHNNMQPFLTFNYIIKY